MAEHYKGDNIMAEKIFTDWGTKPEEPGGVYVQKGKRIRKLKTKRAPKGEKVGGIRYDKRVKPKEKKVGSISYGASSKPESVGGISYGKRHEPEMVSAYKYEHKEPVKGEVVGGISYGEKHEAYTVPMHSGNVSGIEFKSKKKPLFGEDAPLTHSEEVAKQIAKRDQKRIEAIEKSAERRSKIAKGIKAHEKRQVKAAQKAQKKALAFKKTTPLAKALRKRLHF